MTIWDVTVDLAVVGTGVAGLTAALRAAELGLRVVAVTKTTVEDGNTRCAQGGIAVVWPGPPPGDSVDAHVADTLVAGAGLCRSSSPARKRRTWLPDSITSPASSLPSTAGS